MGDETEERGCNEVERKEERMQGLALKDAALHLMMALDSSSGVGPS